ncbi:acyl-CoA dehydrogenase family protein [Kitasatospora sp. NPDC056446]|uniref:acyl-CoA dehydrogenase family protein n=1 Tax=Kitasatospora sp. NPDC056446 TaxID=3345819 RepID=UPI00369E08B0
MVFPNSPTHPGTTGFEPSWVEHARILGERVVRPTSADRDRANRWDHMLFTELAHTHPGPGLAGPLVPREFGGGGLSAVQTCALLEGLGEGARDPGLALAVGTHVALATVPVRAFGSPRQRERYLPRMAAAEWFGSVSLRQTQGAALDPGVTVRPAGASPGAWVLDGELDLVVGAPVAHHFLVLAAHQDGSRTAFLVDAGAPGLRVGEAGPAAMRTCGWGRLILDGCRVPEGAVLGRVGGAADEVEPLLAALDWVFTSAPWLGLIRAMARDAVDGARSRRLFGRPLADGQSVRFTLADLAIRCELAEGMVYRAAAQFDSGRPSLQDAASARLFVASAVRTVTDGAARLAGTPECSGDHLIERICRDAVFFAETGGGSEVLRPVIAASVLGIG